MIRKQCVVTGATSGIGRETALGLAQLGFDIFILTRNRNKANELIDELNETYPQGNFVNIDCDLSSIKSVDTAAHLILSKLNRLDLLVNNAGGIFQNRIDSADGNELTIAVNHLGPYHLTNRLIPLLENAKGRIVNVSSAAHKQAQIDWSDFQLNHEWSAFKSYANSKLYNILTAKYWANKYRSKGILAFSLHPGVVRTGFAGNFKGPLKLLLKVFHPFMISAKKGAETSIYLCTASNLTQYSGEYFSKCRVTQPLEIAKDESTRMQLINKSDLLIKRACSN